MPGAPTSRGDALVDTNLLVLLVVGATNPALVGEFKRTRKYSRDDFALLDGFLGRFARLAATPTLLGETSNLVGQLAEPARTRAMATLAGIVTTRIMERYEESERVVQDALFLRLGLTDAAIRRAAGAGTTVVTDDLELYEACGRSGVDVINFNHVRAGAW